MGTVSTYKTNGYVKLHQRCDLCKLDDDCLEHFVPFSTRICNFLEYIFLFIMSYARELMMMLGLDKEHATKETNREGYTCLYRKFDRVYARRVYRRVRDIFSRPIYGAPGAQVLLKDRASDDYFWTFYFPGSTSKHINMGSYNYLGFAANKGSWCDVSEESLRLEGISYCSTRRELGSSNVHEELEGLIATYLGVEAAITFGMGFATNSMNIPALVGNECLILSDRLNHASLVVGEKLSGAIVKIFRHNDMVTLEKYLKEAIVYGQPKTRRPWKKIIIIVEGVYSMEGDIVKLPEVISLKKKYKAYLYLDEAHSIGALGGRGRGVVDYWGCDPKDVDIMMGTFTKSFNAAGGYIAGTEKLIRYLKATSHAHCYATSMAPSVARQVMTTMRIVMADCDGSDRISRLKHNTRYFRRRLKKLGFTVYGDLDSPVVPVLLYHVTKVSALIRWLLEHGIVAVGVGFPAVSLFETRARFCISASHTKEMLDHVVSALDEAGDNLGIRYCDRPRCSCPVVYEDL